MIVSLPAFDLTRCDSTGYCVAACPTECLALREDDPFVAEPEKCLSCGVCQLVCPTGAVRLDTDFAPVAMRTSSGETLQGESRAEDASEGGAG